MDEKVKVSILCDLYGKLLTEKQYEFLNEYYNNDLSLSEIAENYNITRQAVRDIIKKGEKKLFEYEEKLLFMKRMLNQEKTIQQILSELTKIQKDSSDKKVANILETIKKELSCLVQGQFEKGMEIFMAFEGLSSRLQEITRKLKGKARITDSDLKDMLREVKLALLEADVNYKIVKEFIANIQEKALGQDVLKSLTPGQQVIKIVKDELVELLGGTESKVSFSPNPPTIIMLVGLQGSGKTTTAGKLANLFRKQGKKPLLVACDVYRPAAIKQLQVVRITAKYSSIC